MCSLVGFPLAVSHNPSPSTNVGESLHLLHEPLTYYCTFDRLKAQLVLACDYISTVAFLSTATENCYTATVIQNLCFIGTKFKKKISLHIFLAREMQTKTVSGKHCIFSEFRLNLLSSFEPGFIQIK
jgi:hypothetical protein